LLSKKRALIILDRLRIGYPDYKCGLDFKTPYELLSATVLSAQCTDKQVNKITPAFFKCYPEIKDLSKAEIKDVEELIKSTGFYRNKAKNLVLMAKCLVEQFNSSVPDNIEDLTKLSGVGRKTANVLINEFFSPQGIAVDTHVLRLSNRFGIIRSKDPVKVEEKLMKIFNQKNYREVSHLFITHGRRICGARSPECAKCIVNDICEKKFISITKG
jgi:endonuclease-3